MPLMAEEGLTAREDAYSEWSSSTRTGSQHGSVQGKLLHVNT